MHGVWTVQHVIDRSLWDKFGIGEGISEAIVKSWNSGPPAIYGRFDLAYNQQSGAVKMLEYNADTPTSLLEAAVIQWDWLQDKYPSRDQWNSIHERLVAKWKELADYTSSPLYFSSLHDSTHEDWMTLAYLQETAEQAGLRTQMIPLQQIGVERDQFVDERGDPIRSIFKLYPWEWMVDEDFGPTLPKSQTQWIEPLWKMVLSSKALLPILHELFPSHPNILAASFSRRRGDHVKKPCYSREGANVTVTVGGKVSASNDGPYTDEGWVYQELAPLPKFDGRTAVIGAWVIDGTPAGMGIRESDGAITDNQSRFVPHSIGQ